MLRCQQSLQFARLEDVISCALKEQALFPTTFDQPSKGPSVDGACSLLFGAKSTNTVTDTIILVSRPAVLEGGVKLRRAKMSHMGDGQYQSVGVDAKAKSLAELLVEQGDSLILAGGY